MSSGLSRHHSFSSLILFALPSIIGMIFTSLYTMVDGMFVSRFVNTDALSAVNIVFPFTNLPVGLGIMLGTGGSAIVSRMLGEGRHEDACRTLSLFVLFGMGLGFVLTAVGLLFPETICRLLGASDRLLVYCIPYLQILQTFAPALMLQLMFQMFFVAAGRPGLGLCLTIGAGVLNAVLDYVFIVPLHMGIHGAAWATVAGYLVPATCGVVFFLHNTGLRFLPAHWDGRRVIEACLNGSSEMVSNLASALVTFLYNLYMMRYLGEKGVAAITIVLYAQFLFSALFLGFSNGVAPLFSYQYGSRNGSRLRELLRMCLLFIACSSVLLFIAALVGSRPVVALFAGNDEQTFSFAMHGALLFAPCYLFLGVNIFSSSLFTALSDGRTSAILSFLRTCVFIVASIVFLPPVLGVDGIWLSVPVAELGALAVSVYFLRRKRAIFYV